MIDVICNPRPSGRQHRSLRPKDRHLLTGDSLYPGRLYISDLAAYVASAQRLADFVRTHTIAHVLGTHIEQSSTPYLDYPRGTTYQPSEHRLELTRANVLEMNEAFQGMKDKPEKIALPDFTLQPQMPRQQSNQKK